MKTKRQFKYDYFMITLPSAACTAGEHANQRLADLIQVETDWAAQMCDVAIKEARESARIFAIPCEWQAELLSGSPDSFESVFRVRRRRFYGDKS